MRLLITGAAGFIGNAVFKEALHYGGNWGVSHLVGVDWDERLCNNNRISLGVREDQLICSDFADDIILNRIKANEFDCIIHLAALPRVAFSVENPTKTDLNNINRSVKLLEACLQSNTNMVFASSSSVYGGAKHIPTEETEPLNPVSPYALQKATFEHYLRIYKEIKNYNSISLRFFNVYGPGQDGESAYSTVLAAWMHKIRHGLTLSLEGDGEQRRDFCYVGDVANACLISAQKVKNLHGSFNIANGNNYSCNELLEYLKKRFAKGMVNISNKPPRDGDVRVTLANINKAKDVLGWHPRVSFWDGVDKTIDWWFC